MRKILSEKEFEDLPEEVRSCIREWLPAVPYTVNVCNNCGHFIANYFKDEKEPLPEGVRHAVGYWNGVSTTFVLCVICNKAMREEINAIMGKYGNGQGTIPDGVKKEVGHAV